jgi:heat shock protein HtpX
MNHLKTLVFLATLTGLMLWAGHVLGGQTGLVMALIFAGVMNVGAWWWSDRLVLRMYKTFEALLL